MLDAGTIPLRADDVTIAEVLQRASYRSGGFWKWGLGDTESAGVPTQLWRRRAICFI